MGLQWRPTSSPTDCDEVAAIARCRYRGRDFAPTVRDLLERATMAALPDDSTDAQVVFIGYARQSDLFVVVFDLWLHPAGEAEDDANMAVQVVEARLSGDRTTVLASTRVRREGFYGETEDEVRTKHPDLVDLVLD